MNIGFSTNYQWIRGLAPGEPYLHGQCHGQPAHRAAKRFWHPGGAGPLPEFGSNTFSFGNQLLTTTSAVQSITITNCGSADLNISNVTVTGFGSNDFTVTQNCTGGPIAPGSFCTVNVTFNPQAAGARDANL